MPSALPRALPTVEDKGTPDCYATPSCVVTSRAFARRTSTETRGASGWARRGNASRGAVDVVSYRRRGSPGRGRCHIDVDEVGEARFVVGGVLAAGQRSIVQELRSAPGIVA